MSTRRLRIMHELLNEFWDLHRDAENTGRHDKVRLLESLLELVEAEVYRLSVAADTIRHFEAPGRVRTALTRMVDDVFATMTRREEARDAGDDREAERLGEVEKAHRARLNDYWGIDPVSCADGTWKAVTRDKSLPHGMGACFPAMQAEDATRARLSEARGRGCPSEIQRLEEEERMLREIADEIGCCIFFSRPRPSGFLPAPERHNRCPE